ncbi:hypothetical protein [Burkholderia ubonensis]|uniref:hypothetical protein n=1 Tax=Burkholderia ubonensis TaxID=101571 RepID=UPI000A5401C1|nr:hypothetical protein [Burkholderia ubonensis]
MSSCWFDKKETSHSSLTQRSIAEPGTEASVVGISAPASGAGSITPDEKRNTFVVRKVSATAGGIQINER